MTNELKEILVSNVLPQNLEKVLKAVEKEYKLLQIKFLAEVKGVIVNENLLGVWFERDGKQLLSRLDYQPHKHNYEIISTDLSINRIEVKDKNDGIMIILNKINDAKEAMNEELKAMSLKNKNNVTIIQKIVDIAGNIEL